MTTPYLFRHPDSGIYYFRIGVCQHSCRLSLRSLS